MSFAAHKALDDLYTGLTPLVDRFMECYIGHFKKQPLKTFRVRVDLTSDTTRLKKWLDAQCSTITKMIGDFKDTPGFQNILEEMLNLIDTASYLVNLH